MSKSARSVFAFSLYVFGLGIILIFIPNVLLRLFSIPETKEVWIRIVGVLVFLLGFYYYLAAKNEMTKFFQWTVYARSAVLIFFICFVLFGFVSPVLILFGLVDAAAALWTHMSLRAEKQISLQ